MIRRVLARLFPPPPREVAEPAPVSAQLGDLLRLTDEAGHPNVNDLWRATKDLEALRLNVKMLGYAMAATMEPRLQAIPVEPQMGFFPDSKACTQGDIESRWFRYWCERLKERPRFHRKLWEYAYLMQALHAADAFQPGRRVLGLGAAPQPTASFLARTGAKVVVAHEADQARPERGRDPLYDEGLVDQPTFSRLVERRTVDLSALPDDLNDFDAVWSISTLQHRGSLRAGMDLVRQAMKTLKPGGVAVHILEFNFADDERTIDDWPSVLYQRRHIEALAEELKADGHHPLPLDFNVGFQEMDRFVDMPPYDTGRTQAFDRLWRDGWQGAHLKAMIDGFICSSFGLLVQRGG